VELGQIRDGPRLTIFQSGLNQRAITVQKYGRPAALIYRSDSHLVAACLSRGCETIRCHRMP
jgi:hypothetical protein